MAALNKIRSQAGLLVIVVGVALLAFIVGDFLNSGQSFSLLRQNKVATVNGTDIKPDEFQARAEALTNERKRQYEMQGNTMPDGAVHEINRQVYNQMVSQILLNQEFERLGLSVGKEELSDLFRGENPHYLVRQRFQNTQELDNQVRFLFHPEEFGITDPEQLARVEYERQNWLAFEEEVKQARLQEKLFNLLSKAVTPNKLDLEASFDENKTIADIAYAVQRYSSVADTLVTVTDKELKAEYKKEKERFKTPETRLVKFISLNVVPSETDRVEVETAVRNLQSEFETTDDMEQFLAYNSDNAYENVFYAISSMSGKMKSFAEKAKVNDASAIDFTNNTYTLYRLMETKTAPDSVEARYIIFNPRSEELDSVLNVLKAGGDFEAISKERNDQVNQYWFTESLGVQGGVMKELVDRIFAETGKGYFALRTFEGDFIVQVLNRTAPVKKAKVATFVKTVTPSEETQGTYYNQLVAYVAENGNAEKFVAGAKEAGLFVNESACTGETSMLPNIPGSREVVRWAFFQDTDKGDVSDVFTIGNNETFVVAALEDVVKEGYTPFDQADVKAWLNQRVLQNKKAEKIIADLKSQDLTSLDDYAQAMTARVDTAKFITFATPRIQGIGVEPALNGLIHSAEQGKLVGPVQGNNGVYVFSVTDRTETEQPYNEEAEAQRMQSIYNTALNQAVKVLYDKAKIQNTMYRFF